MFGFDTYSEDIQKFKKVFSSEAAELLNKENLAIVYIGRGTCPYCRKFAKKLSSLSERIDSTIYYVDSEDFSDDGISLFRNKYNVVTVPGFIVGKNGDFEVRCDSSMPEEEILNLVK